MNVFILPAIRCNLGITNIFCSWTEKEASNKIGKPAKGGIFSKATLIKMVRAFKFWRVPMDYDNLLDFVKKRRSKRRFKPDPIPDERIEQIIEVARWAPSGFNMQP